MIRGRNLLLAGILAGMTLAGCGGPADGRAGARRPLTPVSDSLPPATPSRSVLAPEEPARDVLPGDELPGDELPGDGRNDADSGRRAAPARTWRPRDGRARTGNRFDRPGNPDRRTPPATAAPTTGDARPEPPAKRMKRPKRTQVPAPVTEPAAPADPASAPAATEKARAGS